MELFKEYRPADTNINMFGQNESNFIFSKRKSTILMKGIARTS
jgi:hypothetical protein